MGKKLSSIQSLRGVAAILVVAYHAVDCVNNYGWASSLTTSIGYWGSAGVDIFFALSGFVMVLTTAAQPRGPRAALTFMVARLQRVAPMYWILTTVMVAGLLIFPKAFNKETFDATKTITSYLFIPYELKATGSSYPVIFVGWTLTYEIFFYMIFAASVCFAERTMRIALPLFCTLLASLSILKPDAFILRFLTNPILLEFVFGCLLGWAYTAGARAPKAASAAIAGSGVIFFAVAAAMLHLEPRFLFVGIPATALVAGAILFEAAVAHDGSRLLIAIGDSSYSLYLTHALAIPLFARVLAVLDRHRYLPGDVTCILLVALCVILALLVYRVVEFPINNRLQLWRARIKKDLPTPTGARI